MSVTAVGLLAFLFLPQKASATAVVVVKDPTLGRSGSDGSAESRYTSDQVSLLRSGLVGLKSHQLLLEREPPIDLSVADLRAGLTLATTTDSNAISLTFSAEDAETARNVADTFVGAYSATQRARIKELFGSEVERLTKSIQRFGDESGALRAQRTELTAAMAAADDGISAQVPALVDPERPVRRFAQTVGFSLLLGLLVAATFCYFAESRHPRVRASREPEAVLGQPLIAELEVWSTPDGFQLGRGDAKAAVSYLQARARATGARVVAIVAAGTDQAEGVVVQSLLAASRQTEHSVSSAITLIGAGALVRNSDSVDRVMEADAAIVVVWKGMPFLDVTGIADRLSFLQTEPIGYLFVTQRRRRTALVAPAPVAETIPMTHRGPRSLPEPPRGAPAQDALEG